MTSTTRALLAIQKPDDIGVISLSAENDAAIRSLEAAGLIRNYNMGLEAHTYVLMEAGRPWWDSINNNREALHHDQ